MRKEQDRHLPDKEVLRILSSVLKENDISDNWFSLGGYQEEAVCLEKNNANWIVYDGERGNQNHLESINNIEDACLVLISRLSESDEIEERITDRFHSKIENKSSTVTKKDLAELLSARLEISYAQADSVLGILPQVIGEELQAGKKVQLTGLGTFDVADRAARVGRNPQTGEVIQIPATRSPRFKAGKFLRETVKRS